MPIVPLTTRIAIEYRAPGGDSAFNILHIVSLGGTFSQANMDDIADAWAAFWAPQANDNWQLTGAYQCLHLATDPPGELFAAGADDNGQGSGDVLPASCALVVSLSAGSGRRRKGRIYLPGIGDGDVDDLSRISSAFAGQVVADFTTFAATIGSDNGWLPAVYSREDGVARVATVVSVGTRIDTQRRRLPHE